MLRHVTEPLPPAAEVADVDPEISAWIDAADWPRTRQDRPQSATAAWEALEEILIAQLGPRWRREARLPEPPSRARPRAAHVLRVTQLAWERHADRPTTAGIDVDGTGPDTGELADRADRADAPAAETAPRRPIAPTPHAPAAGAAGAASDAAGRRHAETPARPPPPRPPPSTPTPPAPTRRRPRRPRRAPRASRGDAAAAARRRAGRRPQPTPVAPCRPARPRRRPRRCSPRCCIPLVAEGIDRWNVFAVLSPLEAVGHGVATLVVSRALRAGATDVTLAAGWLIGLGAPAHRRRARAAEVHARAPRRPRHAPRGRRRCSARSRSSPPASAACAWRGPGRPAAVQPRPARARPRRRRARRRRDVRQLRRVQLAVARAAGGRQRGVLLRAGARRDRWRSSGSGCSVPGRGSPAGCCSRSAWPPRCTTPASSSPRPRPIGEEGDVRSAGFIGILGGLLILAAGALASRSR